MKLATRLCSVGLVFSVGCGAEEEAAALPCPPSEDPVCWSDHYFRRYGSLHTESCAPEVELAPLELAMPVRLFRSSKLSDAQCLPITRGLERYYAPHRLSFVTESEAAPIELASFVADRGDELDSALDRAGVPRDRELGAEEQAAADAVLTEVLFADLRAFMQRAAQPAADRINFVIVDEIVPRALASRLPGLGETTGLGFSPRLLAALAGTAEGELIAEILGVSGSFTPTVFVARAALARSGLRADELAAHEVGHAFGLSHSDEFGNLMRRANDYGACRPVLTERQIASMLAPADPAARPARPLEKNRAPVDRPTLVRSLLSMTAAVLAAGCNRSLL